MNRRMLGLFSCASLFLMLPISAATPAEIGIGRAHAQIAENPQHYPFYNALAMAYARRARETSDVAFYQNAEEALAKSFAIAPDNFEGMKVHVCLLLGRHEFAKALDLASRLNKNTPDDVTVYGYLVDANIELGNYDEAVTAAQWMLNLRPGNIAGLTRAADLRELHGYLTPAMEAIQKAYDATPYQEAEDRAWLLTKLAHLCFIAGDLPKAEMYANGALGLFPGYPYPWGALAEVRMEQQRYEDAVELLRKRYDAAPRAENMYALGEALMAAGHTFEAHRAFAEFERRALLQLADADNANRELIAYYVDYAHRPAEAVALAEKELARRHDVLTMSSYAWALAAAGDYRRADLEIHKVLAVGVKEPTILRHAQEIEKHFTASAGARESEAERH